MARGRNVPPPVVVQGVQPGDHSQAVDGAYFRRNPKATQYERAYIIGETLEPMPPGTRVLVKRIGRYRRVRAFCPPQERLN